MVWQMAAWFAALAAVGFGAAGCLRRLGVGTGTSWAVARVAGLTVQAYVAWIAGWAGLTHWWWVGVLLVIGFTIWGARGWRGAEWRALIEPELVGAGAFLLLAYLRLPSMAVTATEKPMDLGILATLLRPGGIPPQDMWLAGRSLPYYYWGFVPWVLPAKVCGLAPDVVFNLLVPTLAAVSAQAAWALARALGGSRRSGVMAAFLVVFSGTLDGWRQLATGKPVGDLDLWAASRAIHGTITEFPLFTFQLGDLHPHLLCVPLALAAIFLGRLVGKAGDAWLVPAAACALTYGAAAAANPWCALPLGAAILLVAVADEGGFVAPVGGGWRRWLRIVALGALGWALYLPFWLNFHPPTAGFGLVTTGTTFGELVFFLGAALVPACLVAWELALRFGGIEAARRLWSRAAWLAATVLLIVLTRRPALVIAVVAAALLAAAVLRGKARRGRPAFALTLVGLALVAFMETVHLKDFYGPEYYRMNTVFKASHLALTLLAVTGPVLLGWVRRRRLALAVAGAVVVGAAGIPQLVTLAVRAHAAPIAGWGGLGWMAPGEADAARFLRSAPAGTVLIEGIGDAYSDAARISAASGVPAVLGWENHESVWRGGPIGEETGRRRAQVDRLYRCGDGAEAQRIARSLGARFIVVGSVERRLYPAAGLDAVVRSGPAAFASGGCTVVAVGS